MVVRYTTKENIQSELRLQAPFSESTVPSTSTVEAWIEGADSFIDVMSGRKYGATTYTELVNYDGSGTIQLSHAPIVSITSVKYSTVPLGDSTYPAWETKTADTHYTVFEDRGEIEILTQNWEPLKGNKRVEVVYVAGYETAPAHIQMLSTKLVAKRAIDTAISQDLNEKQSGKSISVGSISIVKSASFGVQNYMRMKEDIEDLKKQLTKGTGVYRYCNY